MAIYGLNTFSNILNQSILDNIISLAHEALEILSKFVVPITG
jgi:hypothetical protein